MVSIIKFTHFLKFFLIFLIFIIIFKNLLLNYLFIKVYHGILNKYKYLDNQLCHHHYKDFHKFHLKLYQKILFNHMYHDYQKYDRIRRISLLLHNYKIFLLYLIFFYRRLFLLLIIIKFFNLKKILYYLISIIQFSPLVNLI